MDFRILAMLALMAAAILGVAGTTTRAYPPVNGAGNLTQPDETAIGGEVTYYYSTVTMSSFASESVKPDTASFVVTIKTFDENSKAESSRHNAESAKKVKDALAANGLDKSDMATSTYYVTEKYNSTYDYGYYNGDVLTGYETTHEILVKTDKLDSLGRFFDTALQNGASDVGDVRWSLKEDTVLELQKRLSKEAMENVNEKVIYAFPEAEEYDLNSVEESLAYSTWNYYPGYTFGASWYGFTDGDELTEVEIPDIEIKVDMVAQYIVRDFDAAEAW
ncbi:MAG: SIMPL domain-containing protein [Candidatus Micrarchaeota archaeon]